MEKIRRGWLVFVALSGLGIAQVGAEVTVSTSTLAMEEAKGRRSAAESQYADTRAQLEEDVRLALQTPSAEGDDDSAAETELKLAERELQLAEDRFTAGVGTTFRW